MSKSYRASASASPTTWNESERTVEIEYATDTPVIRDSYEHPHGKNEPWYEQLSFLPGAINDERAAAGKLSCLDNHWGGTQRRIFGSSVAGTHRVDSRSAFVTMKFRDTEEALSVFRSIGDKTLTNFSMIYQIESPHEFRGKYNNYDLFEAPKWCPLTVDVVDIAADPNATARSFEMDPQLEKLIAARVAAQVDLKLEELSKPSQATDASGQRSTESADTGEQGTESKTEASAEITEARRLETLRCRNIAEVATRHSVGPEEMTAAIDKGTSADAFRAYVLDLVAKRGRDNFGHEPHVAHGSGDNLSQQRRNLAEALCLKVTGRAMGFNQSTGLPEATRDPSGEVMRLHGARLLDIVESAVRAQGISTVGPSGFRMTGREIVKRAMTTAMFPILMGDFANLSLAAIWTKYVRAWEFLVTRRGVADFKLHREAEIQGEHRLLPLNEHGEVVPSNTIYENFEGFSTRAYYGQINITWEMLVNDDLGGISNLLETRILGLSTLEDEMVLDAFLKNSLRIGRARGISRALFHPDNKNDVHGAFSAESLARAEDALFYQTMLDGKTHLRLTPRYLMCSREVEDEAIKILSDAYLPTSSQGVQTSRERDRARKNRIEIRPVPELRGESAWFLVAAEEEVMGPKGIILTHLEGYEGLQTTEEVRTEANGLRITTATTRGIGVGSHVRYVRGGVAPEPEPAPAP